MKTANILKTIGIAIMLMASSVTASAKGHKPAPAPVLHRIEAAPVHHHAAPSDPMHHKSEALHHNGHKDPHHVAPNHHHGKDAHCNNHRHDVHCNKHHHDAHCKHMANVPKHCNKCHGCI